MLMLPMHMNTHTKAPEHTVTHSYIHTYIHIHIHIHTKVENSILSTSKKALTVM